MVPSKKTQITIKATMVTDNTIFIVKSEIESHHTKAIQSLLETKASSTSTEIS